VLKINRSTETGLIKMVKNQNQISGDSVQNLRRETSRKFRKERECLKEIINELETSNKNKNIRDLYREINEFKKRINVIKDEKYNLLAYPHFLQ
jgi:hypothetical protein